MIPKLLTIQGIYSYQEKQTVDFEKLTQSKLFGVFGSVGSGKSTLLEAISFALYGRTERLGARDNLGYNMMNLKSNELFIHFEFENYDNKRYQFIIEGKRNSKRFEDVKTFQRRASVFENDKWNPLESASAESILDLSYDNFRRTIIIPQGKFQEFLQLKDKERTDMLKEIFNLSKFDYFYQIASLAAINDREREKLLGQISHYQDITKESLVNSQNQLIQLQKKYTEEKIKQETNIVKEKGLSLLKDSFVNLESKKIAFKNLQKKKTAILEKEELIKKYEYVLIHFKEVLSLITNLKSQEVSFTTESRTLKNDLENLNSRLKLKQEEQSKLKIELENLPIVENKIKDLNLILQINNSKEQLIENGSRLAKGEKIVGTLNSELLDLEKEITNKEKELSELIKNQVKGSAAEFSDLILWYKEYELVLNQIKALNLQKTEAEVSFKEQKNLIVSSLKNLEIKSTFLKNNQLEILSSKLERESLEDEKTLDILTKKLQAVNVKQELDKWAKELHEGIPCPLCGSVDHPKILSLDSIQEHQIEINNQIKNIKLKKDIKLSNLLKIKELSYLLKSNFQTLDKFEKGKSKLLLEQDKLQNNFNSISYTFEDKTKVEKQFELFKKQENVLQELKLTLDRLSEKFRAKLKDKERFKEAFEKIESIAKTAQIEIKTYKNQLSVLVAEEYINNEIVNIELEKLKTAITSIKTAFELVEKEVLDLNKQVLVKEERYKNQSLALEKLGKEINAQEGVLSSRIIQSSFESKEQILLLLSKKIDLEQTKNEVKDFNLEEHSLGSFIKEKELELANKTFDNTAYESLVKLIEENTKALEALNEDRINRETKLKKEQSDFKNKLALSESLNNVDLRGENIATLKNLFKGSGFVNYISSVYLQNLCSEANIRFYKLTKQQLKLEINEKNEFLVRDYLNEGKVRSVKTLSGGQLFQASLSLALALAESIQAQNNANQNFFFLDEGFGSQDKESLQTVFDSLKALRKENRIVGVISHVEELQQEISTYLAVINNNDTGSKITTSWG